MSDAAPRRADTEAQLDTGLVGVDRAVAVTPHHLATAAALDVIAAGGNAADGAIAANAVLGVVLPDTCGIGGDLFALVHRFDGDTPQALNASGRAGSGARGSVLRDAGYDEMPLRGRWSVTVPGCIDGWESLSTRHGRLPLGAVLAPAIALADDGFPVSSELSSSLHRVQGLIGGEGSAPALYPDGVAPAPGATLRRPQLARVLRLVADAGREAFYAGPVGLAITDATGGLITGADLERRQDEWVDPLRVDVFGQTGWTVPPNSQGYLTLAACSIFEALGPSRDPDDPAAWHAAIEAYRAVAWERDHLVSDPDAAPTSPTDLLDGDRLLERAALIDPHDIARWPTASEAPGGTASLCVRDPDGMGVSLIQSNFHGIGSGLSAADTGVFLHNRGGGFTLEPSHPNELAPGKRPLHTLSPSMWTRNGSLAMLLGTRGGHYQPQLLAQMASLLLWHGVGANAAQTHPRWTIDEWGENDTGAVRIEARVADSLIDGLETRGHEIHRAAAWEQGWGPVSLIAVETDAQRAAADPRVATTSARAG